MTIDSAALRYWTASKALLNPATPAEEADDAGLALLSVAQYSRNERLSAQAYNTLAIANEQGLLDFETDYALEA